MENGRIKVINHNFVQGQGNPPKCQRFATSTTQASLWTANLCDTQVDFPVPVQSFGRFLQYSSSAEGSPPLVANMIISKDLVVLGWLSILRRFNVISVIPWLRRGDTQSLKSYWRDLGLNHWPLVPLAKSFQNHYITAAPLKHGSVNG